MESKKKAAYSFLVLLGIVSLFSDLTYEGARSILGPYLLLLGASASTVGFVSGLGEFIGYALRLVTGYISDKTKRYWLIAIIGYAINLIAIPALALAPGLGWVYACGLIVLERFGKAIRNPAKTTLASFAAAEVGAGKGFALQEVLDQFGAFLGPLMLFLVLTLKGGDDKLSAYSLSFALLAIPAALTLIILFIAKHKYPRPHEFETTQTPLSGNGLHSAYWYYLAGIGFLALGFADFPLTGLSYNQDGSLPRQRGTAALLRGDGGRRAICPLLRSNVRPQRNDGHHHIVGDGLALCAARVSLRLSSAGGCGGRFLGYRNGSSGIHSEVGGHDNRAQRAARHCLWLLQCGVRGILVCGELDYGYSLRQITALSGRLFGSRANSSLAFLL